MKKKKIPTYREDLMERVRDINYAKAYLQASLEDDDPRVFLLALRDVVEAQGGVTKFSKLTNISREHIYRMLSDKENPELTTIQKLLNALNFKLSISIKSQTSEAA